jgi:hypothetical protein
MPQSHIPCPCPPPYTHALSFPTSGSLTAVLSDMGVLRLGPGLSGSIDYLAPECVGGHGGGPASDAFALGTLLLQARRGGGANTCCVSVCVCVCVYALGREVCWRRDC